MNKENIVKAIKEDGYALINNVISSEKCDYFKEMLNVDVDRYMGKFANTKVENKNSLHNLSGEKIVYNLHNKRLEYYELLAHPLILDVCDILLKEGSYKDSEPYYLYNNSARSPKKHSQQQLHIDSRFPGTQHVFVLNALWLLDDFTEASGATRIVPKSHMSGRYAEDGKKYDNEKLLLGGKGSLLLFDASLWHGSSFKHNEDDRWALTLGYSRWFRRPAFNYLENIPEDIFAKLTIKQKELLGLRFFSPKDEFTRIRSISKDFEVPKDYKLPI